MKNRSLKYFSKRIPEKIRQKMQVMKNTLVIFVWNNGMIEKPKLEADIELLVLNTYDNYLNYFNSHNIDLNTDAFNRYSYGASFCALTKKEEIITSGWYVENCAKFHLAEIDRFIKIPFGVCFLFDYFTQNEYRGHGYYPMLLVNIQYFFNNKTLFIYALASNEASARGIEKAGFKELGHYKHFSKDFVKVMKAYNISIVNK